MTTSILPPPSGAGSRGLQTAKGGVGRRRTPALGVEEGLDGIADLRLSMLAQCDAAERQRFGSLRRTVGLWMGSKPSRGICVGVKACGAFLELLQTPSNKWDLSQIASFSFSLLRALQQHPGHCRL